MLQAVIIAGGNGTRMRPLTSTRPKPLLRIINQTILEHNLKQLIGLVKEVIVVIGYKGEMIRSVIGDSYSGLKIKYLVQKSPLGTGDAAKLAESLIAQQFILLNGDDLYFREDIKELLKKTPSILLGTAKNPSFFGVVETDGNIVKSLVEKPEKFSPNSLVNTGLYFLDKEIFNFKIQKSPRGEYEFTDYISQLMSTQKLYFQKTEQWISLSYPWNLFQANEIMFNKVKRTIVGQVEKNCFINGEVLIEEGVLIKGGTRIEGPVIIGAGTIVGPNAFIKGQTVIGCHCYLGAGVEVESSIIGDKSCLSRLNYVGDSILGENCYLSGGAIIANLRFDGQKIKININQKEINSDREKLGAILGDHCQIGVNASLMPGTMIGSGSIIGPGMVVKGVIADNSSIF